jgi:ATP-dependent Clp protease ATP-binding subunit ClpC
VQQARTRANFHSQGISLGLLFERFTDRARRVVVLAQEEARLLNHNYIGTEHLLLGLIQEGEGVAAKVLEQLGVERSRVRAEVERRIGHGGREPSGAIPFTPRAKTALELSLREALQMGHNYIGTEHILLGLVREGQGVAVLVLTELGVELETLRRTTLDVLAGVPPSEPPLTTAVSVASCPVCRLSLAGNVAVQALSVKVGESESIDQQVLVAYCRSCGCSVGLVAASPPSPPAPPPTT